MAFGGSAQAATAKCNNRVMMHGYVGKASDGTSLYGQAGIPSFGTNVDCVLPLNTNTGTDTYTSPVFWLQLNLNQCYGQSLVLDGIYGAKTKAAVMAAQKAASGVTADGIYGPQTRSAIKWYTENLRPKTRPVAQCLAYSALR